MQTMMGGIENVGPMLLIFEYNVHFHFYGINIYLLRVQ